MAALPGGFKYEGENNNTQAFASDGNLPADKISNLLGSGDREHANDDNAGEANNDNINNNNINHIIARLWIKKLKL